MNVRNLSEYTRVQVAAGAAAAAQTAVTGAVLDMQGFENVRVLAVLGDVSDTSVLTLKLQGGSLADGSDMADLAGVTTAAFTATASSADSKVISLDCVKPGKRYVRAVLTRGTANAAVACVLAELYDARMLPAGGGDVVASAVKIAP